MLGGQWSPMVWPGSVEGLEMQNPQTGVDIRMLREIGMASVRVPVDFVSPAFIVSHWLMTLSMPPIPQEVHPRLQRHIKSRIQSLESGKGVDWGTAEVRRRQTWRVC
jgi:probable 2-oxoglutarate dehydrogenase E1 component DHKTD1